MLTWRQGTHPLFLSRRQLSLSATLDIGHARRGAVVVLSAAL
jgi:hypothetical protein